MEGLTAPSEWDSGVRIWGAAAGCLRWDLGNHAEKLKSKRARELLRRETVLVERGRGGVRTGRNLGPRFFWKEALG